MIKSTPLSPTQLKQLINATQCYQALAKAYDDLRAYRGSMYWQRSAAGDDYLLRDKAKSERRVVGRRSPLTEKILSDFTQKKALLLQRESALRQAFIEHGKINKALRVGSVDPVAIDILNEIEASGLKDHFMVIGTNALFAYTTMAGVVFNEDITATEDIDLLWDSRKKLDIVVDETFIKDGLLGVIKKADKSFELDETKSRAVNKHGYMIDLIKRRPKSLFDDRESGQLIRNEENFWAFKIHSMEWLLSSPKFKQVVVGLNGSMAEMTTVDPRAFVLYKTWLSQQDDRNPQKKTRDLLQAIAVFELIQEYLPHLSFDHVHVFPERIRELTERYHFPSVDIHN